uniref:Malignant fibrous histiocytoma-amplified sequence 1 homolog n=1 Tax=Saccoglossus kowalevskii TaxID=10224 RepID=A0ABM0MAK3_SACKO|nr:PREDICTED: malignant fibrous histiocytoma-amplified sequence 1 homolog [Saccoglossus kowalevskii]
MAAVSPKSESLPSVQGIVIHGTVAAGPHSMNSRIYLTEEQLTVNVLSKIFCLDASTIKLRERNGDIDAVYPISGGGFPMERLVSKPDVEWVCDGEPDKKLNKKMGSILSKPLEPKPKLEITKTTRLRALPETLFHPNSDAFKTLKLTDNEIITIQPEIQDITSLEVIDLSHNRITHVPYQLLELPRLSRLILVGNNLKKIYDVDQATKLQYLDLSENAFERMSDVSGLYKLRNLRNLHMKANRLTELPDNMRMLHALQYLDCSLNAISTIGTLPPALQTLKLDDQQDTILTFPRNVGLSGKRLKHLDLGGNKMDSNITEETDIGVLNIVSQMTNLTYLNVESNNIRTVPTTFHNLTNLKTFILRNNNVSEFPVAKSSLHLEHLNIDNNQIHTIDTIPLRKIKQISVRSNLIQSLPVNMTAHLLEELYLDDNMITDILNINFCLMPMLRVISLKSNQLKNIPETLCQISNLESLNLEDNRINSLPEKFSLQNLKKINLSKNKFEKFPTQLKNATHLEIVNLSYNTIGDTETSDMFSSLHHLKSLNMENTQSKYIPDGCIDSPTLEELLLGGNNIEQIPEEIQNMKNLRVLSVENNNLVVVPMHIFQHMSLEAFLANGNRIHTISKNIPTLDDTTERNLSHLNVGNNFLKSVPKSVEKVTSLKKLDVSYNLLYFLPSALVELVNTNECENAPTEVIIMGNLARNIPSSIDKRVALAKFTTLTDFADAQDLSDLKRGCMYFIGSRHSGKTLLMNKLMLSSGSNPYDIQTAESRNSGAFLSSNIWPANDKIDINVTDCSGPVELQVVHHLFYVPNALYVITVNLEEYKPSTSSAFQQHIEYWIKDVYSVIGGDFMVQVVGTHCDKVEDDHIKKCCGTIKDSLKRFFDTFKVRNKTSDHFLSSPCDVLTVGSSRDPILTTQWIQGLQTHICEMLKNNKNKLLPIDVPGLYNDGMPCMLNMLKLEQILVEKQQEEEGLQKIRLTTFEFEELCEDVGMKQSGVDDAREYLKRIGVIQCFTEESSLCGYIFHNIDYLKTILHTIAGKNRDELLSRRMFPPGFKETIQVILNIFNEKAVLSSEVLSLCIFKHLEVDDSIINLILDILIGLSIAYEVPASENEDSFLHRHCEEDDPPRVVLLPAFLQNNILEHRIQPVFAAKIEFPWYFPKNLINVYMCDVHTHVNKGSRDMFLATIGGVPTAVQITKAGNANIRSC